MSALRWNKYLMHIYVRTLRAYVKYGISRRITDIKWSVNENFREKKSMFVEAAIRCQHMAACTTGCE